MEACIVGRSDGDRELLGHCLAQASVWVVWQQAPGSRWSFHVGPVEITIYCVNPSGFFFNVSSVKEGKQDTLAVSTRAHL